MSVDGDPARALRQSSKTTKQYRNDKLIKDRDIDLHYNDRKKSCLAF